MSATRISGQIGVEEANRRCADVTRAAAANFYYGIRLLPADKRAAMCAIYALARRIDDIGDSGLPADESIRQLDEQRWALLELQDGAAATAPDVADTGVLDGAGARAPDVARPRVLDVAGAGAGAAADCADAVLIAIADARDRFEIPISSLIDLIEGVRMDAVGARFQTFEELLLYCRRVAGSIGRLSLAIFGAREREAAGALADDLGVAMQLTNILRDIREDAERGRIYLPSEDLIRYRLRADAPLEPAELLALTRTAAHADRTAIDGFDGGDAGQLFALMRFEALRAHDWFAQGLALLPLLDRRSAACVSAMSGIYRRVLVQIERRPDAALAARASLPVHWKAWVALGSLLAPQRLPRRAPTALGR
ncbi:MAG: phytoene/squalene synthase family protein [Solirubrobacteraceae bacterium]